MMTTNITSLTILQIALICIGALLFSLGIVYLIMSLGGTNNIFVSFDKILIFALINIILTAVITYGTVSLTNKYVFANTTNNQINNSQAPESGSTSSSTTASGATSISK